MLKNRSMDFLSSDENDECDLKTKKKFSKIESDAEEGEISSDDNNDDNDDDDGSNLEKLFKNKDDRRRLLKMSEKEREEEIFKRSLEMNDIKSRQKAVKLLNEQRRRDHEERPRNKKRSLEDVFGHCSDNESLLSSSSIDSNSQPSKRLKILSPQINPRQRALENQKSSKNEILSQLQESRKQKREKLEKLQKDKAEAMKKTTFDSDTSDDEEKKVNNVDHLSTISSSSSEQMEDLRDEFEDKFVEEMEDLSKIRLSRHKLESWVHMPFFKDLIKSCFVRVNIGEGPEVIPVYRIAEIIDVVETVKIYDLGKTRTNVGLRLRIGNSVTMFRLPFVSNQNFLQAEFDSWRRRVISDTFPLPKISFIEEKFARLKEYSNFSINTEETMKQVLMSKQRFQKGPVNIALRKAELTRLKMAAENDGDVPKANQFQDEIDELNMKAEKLERKRTEGIKNISYINQRNRETTMEHVEKAIELEMAEKIEWDKKGGDPFVREPTKPVLNYKKKKLEKEAEELRKQNETAEANLLKEILPQDNKNAINNIAKREPTENKININNIHDFELNLDINIDNAHNVLVAPAVITKDITGMIAQSMLSAISTNFTSAPTSTLVPATSNGISTANQGLTSKRVLNLQDYKRRKGLI